MKLAFLWLCCHLQFWEIWPLSNSTHLFPGVPNQGWGGGGLFCFPKEGFFSYKAIFTIIPLSILVLNILMLPPACLSNCNFFPNICTPKIAVAPSLYLCTRLSMPYKTWGLHHDRWVLDEKADWVNDGMLHLESHSEIYPWADPWPCMCATLL